MIIVWLKLEVEIKLSKVKVLDNINWFRIFFLLIEVFFVDWLIVVDIKGDIGKVNFDEVYFLVLIVDKLFLFIIFFLMNIDLLVKNIFNSNVKEVRLFFIINFCKKYLLSCIFWVILLDIFICFFILFLLFFWDVIVLLIFLFIFLFNMFVLVVFFLEYRSFYNLENLFIYFRIN